MSLICWNLFQFEHRGGVWGFGFFFSFSFLHGCARWAGSAVAVWGVCGTIFVFLVTALCWLSRNTLDAVLSSSPSGRPSQQHRPVFVKTFKALASGTIWAWYFCGRLALKKKKNHLKLFSMGLWVSRDSSKLIFFRVEGVAEDIAWWCGAGLAGTAQHPKHRKKPVTA